MTRSTLSDVVEYAKRMLAERTQILCAGRAGMPEILQLFRAIFCAKFASSRRWTRALSCIRRHANSEKSELQRRSLVRATTPAEFTQLLGAGRAGFPTILQILRANFAQNLRHLDAGLARYLALECKPIRNRAATRFCALRNNAGRLHAIFVRAARRFFS